MSTEAGKKLDPAAAELERLNAQLDEAMSLFAVFEASLNDELKLTTDPRARAEIFARRAAYEATLGVDAILDRISALPKPARR